MSGEAPTLLAADSQMADRTVVILVRHAERADVPGDDPPLSAAGQARAAALALALGDAGVRHVIATSRQRTVLTARPLADAHRLAPEIISVAAGIERQVADVAAAVRKRAGSVVLVVGHSNTVPAIVHALGGPKMPDLCDDAFSTMFVLELPTTTSPARLIRAHYGAADPAGSGSCTR